MHFLYNFLYNLFGKGSYRDRDLKLGSILLIIGISLLLIATLISYIVTGKLDHNVGNSWCLLPVGIISILTGLSKILGAITGTSDSIGSSTTFNCPYCKKAISTKEIPIEGDTFTCPNCKKLMFKDNTFAKNR